MLEITITNDSDSALEFNASGGHMGSFAIYDRDRQVSSILCRSFKLLSGGWDSSLSRFPYDIVLAPHETTTVRWLAVVPDFALGDPTLFFLISDYEGKYQGFEVWL